MNDIIVDFGGVLIPNNIVVVLDSSEFDDLEAYVAQLAFVKGDKGDPGSGSGGSNLLTNDYEAGEDINGQRLVMLGTDGLIYLYQPIEANYGKLIGMVNAAIMTGNTGAAIEAGMLESIGFGFSAGVPYYAIADGKFSDTPPSSGLIHRIGVGVSNDKININISEPIVLT